MTDTHDTREKPIRLLLVDDEGAFRQAAMKALGRRGYQVTEASSGEAALEHLSSATVDLVLLDLKMAGLDGIETLKQLRKQQPDLPVVILTGHGQFDDAVTGIGLRILDFLQKPVDLQFLASHLRTLLAGGHPSAMEERSLKELMVPVDSYPRLRPDQTLREALAVLRAALVMPVARREGERGHRSALVFTRDDRFVGMLRIRDVLSAGLPEILRDSPYASFFTGMFLAQAKVVGGVLVEDLLSTTPVVDVNASLVEALHHIVETGVINLPITEKGRLVGIVRDKDLLAELAACLGNGA